MTSTLSDSAQTPETSPRTYEVRTFGCQMNVHDSERMSGLLEANGYVRAEEGTQPDLVVFNTCAVRENASNRLYGNLGQLAPVKRAHKGMQIAVGGCLAQKDQDAIIEKAPWVDVVFGTHNIGALPTLLERARHNHEAQAELLESLEVFPSTLPTKRDHVYSGWVSYGVEFGDRQAFSKLLRACGEIEGLERVRFTSPHPAMFTDDVIDAMSETPNVMPVLHMPLQSGSDKVLKDMRRSYRSKKFLNILDKVRERIPNAVITTDIIVGFPGETEEDFQDTLKVVEQARFSSAFTFQYSIRPGTPAATMENQIPKEVVQERYERLIALQDRIAGEENRKQLGKTVELMVVAEAGRKADQTHRLSGRGPDQRLVHFSVPEGCETPRPGDMVTVPITEAGSFHLISDPTAEQYHLRRTRAGDAWDRSQADSCGTGTTQVPGAPVGLGMPTIGLRP